MSLATLLWPDSDDDGARGALRRTLSVLNGATAGALRIDRTSVSVEAARVDADVTAFRHAVATVRAHDHPGSDAACATCLATLEAAAALDRGDFMDGFHLRDSDVFDDWQRSEQGTN